MSVYRHMRLNTRHYGYGTVLFLLRPDYMHVVLCNMSICLCWEDDITGHSVVVELGWPVVKVHGSSPQWW